MIDYRTERGWLRIMLALDNAYYSVALCACAHFCRSYEDQCCLCRRVPRACLLCGGLW